MACWTESAPRRGGSRASIKEVRKTRRCCSVSEPEWILCYTLFPDKIIGRSPFPTLCVRKCYVLVNVSLLHIWCNGGKNRHSIPKLKINVTNMCTFKILAASYKSASSIFRVKFNAPLLLLSISIAVSLSLALHIEYSLLSRYWSVSFVVRAH